MAAALSLNQIGETRYKFYLKLTENKAKIKINLNLNVL